MLLSTQRTQDGPKLRAFTTFHALLLLLMGVMAALTVLQMVRSLAVINDNVYPESAGVLTALRWVQGQPLHPHYRQSPYLLTPFPPLWYAVMAVGARFVPKNLDSLTFFGRLVSLISLFGTIGLAFLWNRRAGLPSHLA